MTRIRASDMTDHTVKAFTEKLESLSASVAATRLRAIRSQGGTVFGGGRQRWNTTGALAIKPTVTA